MTAPSCVQCRTPIPTDAPQGVCPACLLRIALEVEPEQADTPAAHSTGDAGADDGGGRGDRVRNATPAAAFPATLDHDAGPPPSIAGRHSPATSCSKNSAGAAWGWCTGRGRRASAGSTGSWP